MKLSFSANRKSHIANCEWSNLLLAAYFDITSLFTNLTYAFMASSRLILFACIRALALKALIRGVLLPGFFVVFVGNLIVGIEFQEKIGGHGFGVVVHELDRFRKIRI